jgi:hypothetical protein
MPEYLQRFREELAREWRGSLVKVNTVKKIEANAKEYLNKLAKAGYVERVKWGWYWVPDKVEDPWDFLQKDRNFKVIAAQSAASFWNNDFIHREAIALKVDDKSYAKALQEFGAQRGWNFILEYADPSKIRYRKFGNLFVEEIEDSIIDCIQNWAFIDAFATLYSNRRRVRLKQLLERAYWKRISKTNVRARQALEYGCSLLNKSLGKNIFPVRELKLEDMYVKREIDEAIERVVELG